MVELADRYRITSNRESGFGRYDVLLWPKDDRDDAIILEFKVHDPEDEKDLGETAEEPGSLFCVKIFIINTNEKYK